MALINLFISVLSAFPIPRGHVPSQVNPNWTRLVWTGPDGTVLYR